MAIGVDCPMEMYHTDSVQEQKPQRLSRNDTSDSFDIKEQYTNVIFGGVKIVVGTMDHLSDYLVLYSLWRRGLYKIFAAGMLLDLLPGPVTAAHFSRQGYSLWQCLLLLFHPANLYIHLVLSQVLIDGTFSQQVVVHSRQAQALLEAPMQLVFTLTLVMLRVLPTPFDQENALIIENSFGGRISLSYLPACSVALSFAMIVTNEVMTNQSVVIPSNVEEKRSNLVLWSSFATTTVLFRLHSWVFICSFLGEFSFPIVMALFVLCTGVILQYRLKGVEPLTFSLYCLAFPMACVHSTTRYAKDKLDELNKRIVWALSLVGTLVILLSVWLVYFIIQFSQLRYSSLLRIRRDAVTCHIMGASVTGIFTLVMAKFLTLQVPGETSKKIFPLVVVPTISVVLTAVSIGWYVHLVKLGTGSESLVIAQVKTLCGKPLSTPITLEGYVRNEIITEDMSKFEILKEDSLKTIEGQKLLGSLGEFYLLIDGIPAKPLTQSLNEKQLYLIFQETQIDEMNNSIQDNCIPGVSFVNSCQQTIWVTTDFDIKGPSKIKLEQKSTHTMPNMTGLKGQFWPLIGCDDENKNCLLNDLKDPPFTKINFDWSDGAKVEYGVKMLDGYNLPVSIKPKLGSSTDNCGDILCPVRLSNCPTSEIMGLGNLRVIEGGTTVACKSACNAAKFRAALPGSRTGQDEIESLCGNGSDDRKTQFSNKVKEQCPSAIMHVHQSTQQSCPKSTSFEVTFCPEDPNYSKIVWQKPDINGTLWAWACDFEYSVWKSVESNGESCGPACIDTPGCTHFAWNSYKGGTCWMKGGIASTEDAFFNGDYSMICGVISQKNQERNFANTSQMDNSTLSGKTSLIAWNGSSGSWWALGCDFENQDLTNRKVRAEDCGPTCKDTFGCTHYAWTQYEGGTCWLKNGKISRVDAIPSTQNGILCGIQGPIFSDVMNTNDEVPFKSTAIEGSIDWQPPKFNWAYACDYSNDNNLNVVLVTGDQCGPTCVRTPQCTHFSWKRGSCVLKSGNVGKEAAFFNGVYEMVCGVP